MTAQKTLVLFSYLLLVYLPNQLISVDPCVFDLHAKGIIDLTGVGRVDGTPAWKNVKPVKDDQHLYSYNPCRPFTQSACINVAACQTYATDEKLAYSLGTQNSLQWTVAPGKDLPTLHYTTGERTLVCARGEYAFALSWDEKSLDSIQSVYTYHEMILSHIGNAHYERGKKSLALEYYKETMDLLDLASLYEQFSDLYLNMEHIDVSHLFAQDIGYI
ncbi:unnamed protein product [Rotaria socialis]